MRAVLILALIAGPLAAQDLPRSERRSAELPVEDIAAQVAASGADELDPVLWLSTQKVNERRLQTDHFFRARIDKASGQVEYQLYAVIEGRQSMRPDRVTYAVDGELRKAKASRVNFDVSCYRSSCTHIEDAVAVIPAEDFAKLGDCSLDRVTRFKVFGDYVEGVALASPCNEIAGLILAVEQRGFGQPRG